MNEEEINIREAFLNALGAVVVEFYNEHDITIIDIIACLDIIKMDVFVKHQQNVTRDLKFEEAIERGIL